MTRRRPRDVVDILVTDLRFNGGQRLRRSIRWRFRRLRQKLTRRQRPSLGIIYPVAFGPNGELALAALRSQAEAAGLGLMFGGAPGASSRVVHVNVDSLRQFFELLTIINRDQEFFIRSHGTHPLGSHVIDRLTHMPTSFDLLVLERRAGTSKRHLQCSRIAVEVWTPGIGPYSTSFYESARRLSIVGRLSPALLDELSSRHHDFDEDYPAPDQPTFPIDVVYTWVDDADPAWTAQRRQYQPDDHPRAALVAHDERFRNRDELKYSLRSLELFAPWVRTIHIVTADQCPDWLDTSHPKINLVAHREIYSDPSWLPTFNSSGIETQLHHIPGLASRFLYFNDDFLLGRLTNPGDFFFSNGVIKFFRSGQRAYEPDIATTSEEYIQADRNAIELLKPIMADVGRAIMVHAPYPCDRELLSEMEDRWPEEFAACASSRFRSARDLRPIAFMQYHYGYHLHRALPSAITHRYLALWKPHVIDQLTTTARRRAWKTICINDVGLEADRTAEVNEAVVSFLESYFPSPSQFERHCSSDERSTIGWTPASHVGSG